VAHMTSDRVSGYALIAGALASLQMPGTNPANETGEFCMMLRTNLRHMSYAIWLLGFAAGSLPMPITAQGHYESLTWTPDGKALTVSFKGDLYTLPLDGGPAIRLAESGGRDVFASWAPDGSAVAYASDQDGDRQIYVAALDGSEARPLTDDQDVNSWPAWSPDGRNIAFMKERNGQWQLWIMRSDGSGARRLARRSGNDWNPRWSPDGNRLVFETDRHEGDQSEIYVIRADGTGEQRLTATPGNDIYPAWSPDGERIAFCTIEGGRAFVHVMPVAGGEPELLLEDACWPVWSPDGSRLAFMSARRGEPDRLYVADPDGAGATEVPGPDARPAAAWDKPKVAILIYEGVQIIDHAAPWEVFGQYSLNEVFTVAKDTSPITTFMGMRVLPSYGFEDHPRPDVIVVPGGDARDARSDPEIIDWIRRNAEGSSYVLGVCSGVGLIAEADLLEGRRATTFYNLLDDLAERRPDITVVEDKLVVEDGKYVTTTGTGIEGALRVVERLHGEPWRRVVALNLELQPLPEEERTPRPWLADMNLPSSIYGVFPWREAELARYEGDTETWHMVWRFGGDSIDTLATAFATALRGEGWTPTNDNLGAAAWTSTWSLSGRDGSTWRGEVRLLRLDGGKLELAIGVKS
jgi:putative intracellular protease/amidase